MNLGSELAASRAPHVELSVVAYLPSPAGASRAGCRLIVLDVVFCQSPASICAWARVCLSASGAAVSS